ncbi:MAG: sodium:calcium antiporter [Saprospiraceae bacterium]|nr:sodium:calcium antiporter [Saprospiraceae bacterium]
MSAFGFALCAIIIFFAGKKLSHYGDLLAEMTGLGKAWIGLILMSAVTSLPELMVGISSVTIVRSADLAVGDILGSCAFNLGILSIMDVFTPRKNPLLGSVSQSHILACALGIMLIAVAGMGLFLDVDYLLTPSIGITSLSFAILYFFSVKIIYDYQQNHPVASLESSDPTAKKDLKKVVLNYAMFATIIIVTALALPHFAEQIAEATGLGKSFVGTLFLAISTSLPEVAVSLAAIRLGSTDMAVGNLLGSNIFNIFILFLDDVFYTPGHILKDASDAHISSVFFVVLMSATAIIGLIFPAKEKKWYMGLDTLTIFLFYILNMILLYQLSA